MDSLLAIASKATQQYKIIGITTKYYCMKRDYDTGGSKFFKSADNLTLSITKTYLS